MPGRPLVFSIFGKDHSLFEYNSDRRLSVHRFSQSHQDIPDALVLCRPEKPELVDYWTGVPDSFWASAAAGRTRLVLDASCEGYCASEAFVADLHRFLKGRGVRPGDVAYVTQDRMFRDDYGALCREAGEEPMRVLVFDYFVQRLALDLPADGARIYEQRLRTFEAAGQSRARLFLSLNYTPREFKLMFLLNLIAHGLWDEGLVSFGGFDNRQDGSDGMGRLFKRMRLTPGFDDLALRLEPHLQALHDKGRITFGLGDNPRKHVKETYRADGLAEYAVTWFSVVTETEMGGRLNRLTEKSFKPLLNFHPMLVFGNPSTLSLVRRYGFKTFGEVFDESYDEETDPRRRFDLVFAQLERLCRQDRDRLPKMVEAVSETLKFNAWHGLVELPRRFRDKIQPWLINDLLSGWDVENRAAG